MKLKLLKTHDIILWSAPEKKKENGVCLAEGIIRALSRVVDDEKNTDTVCYDKNMTVCY